jgi:hypothetical protein
MTRSPLATLDHAEDLVLAQDRVILVTQVENLPAQVIIGAMSVKGPG